MLLQKKTPSDPMSGKEAGLSKLQLKHKYQVGIFGRQYTLRTDADESYAKKLAALVEKKMKELSENAKGVDLEKLAIFTAINIAHELYQLKKEQEESQAMMEQKTRDLIDSIEEQFEEFRPG